jgi:NADPH:quinone reductase-like Zn-dependent oxidoreductase
MQAVLFKQSGSQEVLYLAEQPLLEPNENEVRVRLTSIGLNRADLLLPQERYFCKPDFKGDEGTNRIGFEGAGIIDAVGKRSRFKIGDRVTLMPMQFEVNRQGTLAEFGIYKDEALMHTPNSIDDRTAGGIWMAYLTAWGGIISDGGLKPEQNLVITAASSSVGLAGIQIGNMLGATTIATTTSDDKVGLLLEAGADYVINMKSEDYVARIKDITQGEGTDLVFDAVAGPATRFLVQGTKKGSKIIIQGLLDRRPMDIHAGVLMKRLLTIKGFTLDLLLDNPTLFKDAISQIKQGLNQQHLKPIIAKHFKLTEFRQAFDLLSSNRQVGKIIINP